jgi:hypothetical protein
LQNIHPNSTHFISSCCTSWTLLLPPNPSARGMPRIASRTSVNIILQLVHLVFDPLFLWRHLVVWNGDKRINELGAGHFHTTNIHYMEVASRKRIKVKYNYLCIDITEIVCTSHFVLHLSSLAHLNDSHVPSSRPKISDNFEDDTFHELLISKYYMFMV